MIIRVDGFYKGNARADKTEFNLRKALTELPNLTDPPAPGFALVWGESTVTFVSGIVSDCFEGGIVEIKASTPEDGDLLVRWGNHLLPHASVWLEDFEGNRQFLRWSLVDKFTADAT